MNPRAQSKVEAFFEAWANSLVSVLSMLSPGDWQLKPAAGAAEYAPSVRARVVAGGGLQGTQWISFSTADLTMLLRIFLQEEVAVSQELSSSQLDAVAEFVRQWSGLAATALEPVFGAVVLEVGLEPSVQPPNATAKLWQTSEGAQSVSVLFEVDNMIVDNLDRRARSRGAENTPPSMEALLRDGNIGLLLDVELAVMLRFGCRQATLREVLELTSGAVLELDREIQEPVELLLNGRVIARGDVVVVDGNYGLRVTEVASPQQRVNSL